MLISAIHPADIPALARAVRRPPAARLAAKTYGPLRAAPRDGPPAARRPPRGAPQAWAQAIAASTGRAPSVSGGPNNGSGRGVPRRAAPYRAGAQSHT